MKNFKKLQEEIELARKKLDDALGGDADQRTCYLLSVTLDKLIESYIQLDKERQLESFARCP
ncbi:hypothetical protein LQZ18_12130 [Lachnospiraceae bacterium ZAX-1]